MILRTLRSDTCGCGNRMGEFVELVFREPGAQRLSLLPLRFVGKPA